MKRIYLILLCIATACTTLPAAADEFQPAPATEKAGKAAADSAYTRGDYPTAIALYEAILQEGEAAEVYYNLGNSYYKADDVARAILNYERALLLSPGNGDIRANLEIARARTLDKVTPIPEVFLVTWVKSLINLLGTDAWATLAVVCFLLMLAAAALYLFGKRTAWRKWGFFSGIPLLVLVVLFNLFASAQKQKLESRTEAIVLTPSITVRSTPSESGTALFILHEGHKVTVKDDTMSSWKEISIEDGKVGWVPATAIEKI